MSDELPDGWEMVALDDVGIITTGNTPPTKEKENYGGGIPFVKPGDLDSSFPITNTEQTLSEKGAKYARLLRPGAVLVSCIGNLGKIGLAGVPLATNQQINAIEFHSHLVYDKYGYYYCKTLKPWMENEASATTVTILNKGRFSQAPFVLAPFPEQKRIADKLDDLLARADGCQKHLERVPQLLKQFRQSVLAAATSGRLTEDWREENKGIENALDLLRKILNIRLSKTQRQSEHLHIEDLIKNLSFTANYSEDLPETWVFTCIDNIGMVCNGSTPSRKVASYWQGDIPWVSSGEVQNCIIKETRELITQEGYKNSSVRLLPKGTVLIAMIGEGKTRGQSAVLEIEACINQNMAAIILDHGLINSKYLWYWFQSVYEQNRQVGSGSGPQALNCQRVRELPIILPPLPEQHEIVRRVERLFGFADRLEARYRAARAQVTALTPSLLAKAFRGELVGQDEA